MSLSRFRITLSSPWGALLADSDGEALTRLWFIDPPAVGTAAPDPDPLPDRVAGLFERLQFELVRYAGGDPAPFSVPLSPAGSAFQQAVWAELRRIPWGATVTYTDVARGVARLDTVRAVAGAIGRNPIALLIPCHRVVGRDGSLTGYAGGLHRKAALLHLEGALPQQPFTWSRPA